MTADQQYQREAILEHGGHLSVFVETGTAVGETAAWASTQFDRVVTIELQEVNNKSCMQRFWNNPKVTLIRGDSAEWIADLEYMVSLKGSAVWWLDAHFDHGIEDVQAPSGDTPVLHELQALLASPVDHVVLVDDARLFGSDPAYPSLAAVKLMAENARYSFEVRDDVIRMVR
jgi:hypothetical protein